MGTVKDHVVTDMSVATDKYTTATTSTSASETSVRAVRSDDDKSIDTEDINKQIPDIPDFTPPLRINATRVPERLVGSASALDVPPGLQAQQMRLRRRKSDPNNLSNRSGSRSPSGHNFDAGSSLSSLDDVHDPDILTDKMAFLELDLKDQQQVSRGLNNSFSNLPPVTERMSDENLDDCHAFSDVRRGGGSASRGNSITSGGEVSSNVLEPLDEVDDEDSNEGGRVILTNMEKIYEVAEEEVTDSPTLPTL